MAWLGRFARAGGHSQCESQSSKHIPNSGLERFKPVLESDDSICGEDFRDGTFLKKFCARCVSIAVGLVGRPNQRCAVTQEVISLCTGSAMDHMVFDAAGGALQDEGIPMNFHVPITCEMVAEKAKWIGEVREALGMDTACNFTALEDGLWLGHPGTHGPWAL